MKKATKLGFIKIETFLLFLSVGAYIYANEANFILAQQIANNFASQNLSGQISNRDYKGNQVVAVSVDSICYNGYTYLYKFQYDSLWILIHNEKLMYPICAFGFGNLNLDNSIDSVYDFFIQDKCSRIDVVRNSSSKVVNRQWENPSFASRIVFTKIPLLNTRDSNFWKQCGNNGAYPDTAKIYNKFCPDFYHIPSANNRTFVGCTALAMAQVMWYWRWPDHASIPTKIDLLGTTYNPSEIRNYDWDNIHGSLYNTTPLYDANAIASLLRDCGYAGHIIYSINGSAMILGYGYAQSALENTFKYHTSGLMWNNNSQFFETIQNEIDNGRPVICQATKENDLQNIHSFVIDSYENNFFHINMGDGASGWWLDDNFDDYTVSRHILYGIQPDCSQRTDVRYPTYTSVDANTCKTEFSTNDIYFSNSLPLVVNPSGHLIAESGSRIILKPGFHAYLGSNVRLSIRDFPCYDEDSRSGSPDASQVHCRRILSKEDNGTSVLLVSPNPTSSTIQVSGVEAGADIRIYSKTGVPVIQTTETNINVSTLPSGIYILIAFDSNGFQQTKFIKE